jgi:hypothetical protein
MPDDWRTVAEAAAEAKCDRFLADINRIIDTYSTDCPFQPDVVYDQDGKPWPVRPSQMGVADILAFVHACYGELYVGFCRSFDALRVH